MVASRAGSRFRTVLASVAKPHLFYAAPAPGKNFDPAPAPTLLYSKAKFLKRTNFKYMLKLLYLVHMILYDLLYSILRKI
jgi:hypothetical protein